MVIEPLELRWTNIQILAATHVAAHKYDAAQNTAAIKEFIKGSFQNLSQIFRAYTNTFDLYLYLYTSDLSYLNLCKLG